MARSRADIAAAICGRLGRDLDIAPIIEQRIDRLVEKITKSTAEEWKAWIKAPKLAARCRTDLAALRPFLNWLAEVDPHTKPVNFDDLDRALSWIEHLGRIDPADPEKRILPDPRSGFVQDICARYARGLMLEFSKIPPLRSPKNPIYWIAGLLYEAMTNKRNEKGLKRACDAMLLKP